jgi:MoaA/NifB/PqqE/SkfB family radical SAM enzyme
MRSIWKRAHRAVRSAKQIARAVASTHHPLLVHLVPMRRCNLSCAYCNEYDTVSQPVPLEVMKRRLDRLAELGTAMITVSGGEPLMHPDLDAIIVHMRAGGMISSLITNGYYLSKERIERLNRAGLDYLQISIDNVEPDEVSLKSLRLLEPKLRWLAEHAEFGVNINSVLGGGIRDPEDALVVARRARELGFTSSIGIIHDQRGQLAPLGEREMAVYRALRAFGSRGDTRINAIFQDNLALGRSNDWRCRAGARYLYVDEQGLVHYCSQRRGEPGVPLESYTRADIDREYLTEKSCAPFCTIGCVQRVAVIDRWRSPQTLAEGRTARPHPAPAAAPVASSVSTAPAPGEMA